MELAVVGPENFVLGFALSGIKSIFEVDNQDEAERCVEKIIENKQIGIMIIDEKTAECLDERMREKLMVSVSPVVVTLSTQSSQDELRRMIIKSIGIDVWKEEE